MDFEYIQINHHEYITLQQYYDHSQIVSFGDDTGLFIVESNTITKHDSRFSHKYEGHVPQILDILHTYRIVNKEQFFLTLIKTGISYKIVNKPHEV